MNVKVNVPSTEFFKSRWMLVKQLHIPKICCGYKKKKELVLVVVNESLEDRSENAK